MTDTTAPVAARGPGRLHGKVALVKGAPRSIGRAIVESLSDDGASVVVHYRSRRDEADATGAALRERGAEAIAVGETGWLKDLRLEGYAPRRPRGPQALQQALFPYAEAL